MKPFPALAARVATPVAVVVLAVSSLAVAQTSQPGVAPATGPAGDAQKAFVRDAASGNSMEIQIGQYMQEHSQNAQVKALARALVTDHQRAQQELGLAADKAGIKVDEALSPLHKATVDALQQYSGKELDREFVFAVIGEHHKDILQYTYASRNLTNPFLKQYASLSLAALQRHLHMADGVAGAIASVHDVSAGSPR